MYLQGSGTNHCYIHHVSAHAGVRGAAAWLSNLAHLKRAGKGVRTGSAQRTSISGTEMRNSGSGHSSLITRSLTSSDSGTLVGKVTAPVTLKTCEFHRVG